MKKISQLFNNHLQGKKTADSIVVMNKIVGDLKKAGFKPPFKLKRIADDWTQPFIKSRGDAVGDEKEKCTECGKKFKPSDTGGYSNNQE